MMVAEITLEVHMILGGGITNDTERLIIRKTSLIMYHDFHGMATVDDSEYKEHPCILKVTSVPVGILMGRLEVFGRGLFHDFCGPTWYQK